MGKTCPFKDGNTFRRFLEERFNGLRYEQADLFDRTCETVSISFDGWGSGNRKHIIGGIAYWIGPDFERYAINAEFAHAVWGKSGEQMANVLFSSFNKDIKRTSYEEKEDGQLMEKKILHVGL
jgi:hypothetical protein